MLANTFMYRGRHTLCFRRGKCFLYPLRRFKNNITTNRIRTCKEKRIEKHSILIVLIFLNFCHFTWRRQLTFLLILDVNSHPSSHRNYCNVCKKKIYFNLNSKTNAIIKRYFRGISCKITAKSNEEWVITRLVNI